MKIAYIQHVTYESLGVIDAWAHQNHFEVKAYNPCAGDHLPDVDDFDFLIILGGPQSACDVDKINYLRDEMELIQAAAKANKYILGICLGAQLMGVAYGAAASKSPQPEIGCYPIELTPEAQKDPIFKDFPSQFESLHWHFDMIGLPECATVLAKTPGCPRQVVRFSDKAYGLQCHLELNEARTKKLIEKSCGDLAPGQFVQTPEKILAADFTKMNELLRNFLDRFIANSASSP